MDNFSKNLVFLRKKAAFGQEEMAKMLGVKATTYANYETGLSNPTLSTFIQISKALGYTMDELINRDLSGYSPKQYAEESSVKEPQTEYGSLAKENEALKLKIAALQGKIEALNDFVEYYRKMLNPEKKPELKLSKKKH